MTANLIERDIIEIDDGLCDGCGVCVPSCHEGAIQIINGKAKLVDDSFCDGLGDCLADCPQDAITITRKNVAAYDQDAVDSHLKKLAEQAEAKPEEPLACGCPGSASRTIERKPEPTSSVELQSELQQWPVKLELVSPMAPYFEGADIAIIADCVPLAAPNTHNDMMRGNAIAIGCPKFGDVQMYMEKIKGMIDASNAKSLKIYRMVVPCCGGLTQLVAQAAASAKRNIPVEEIMIDIDDGREISRRSL